MPWKKFPHDHAAYRYSTATLKKNWHTLHCGDAEPFPDNPAIIEAWISFHAGEFENAARHGAAEGVDGFSVANKATCIYANYLEASREKKAALYQAVVERCEEQQAVQPKNAAGFYWQGYAIGRYSQDISIVKALAQGLGTKVRTDLETVIRLAPQHADAHVAMGVYHAEIIDKVGSLVGGLTYGASKEEALHHFKRALKLHPGSAIARIEYAKALIVLEGKARLKEAVALYQDAASTAPRDAMEKLDVELAKKALER